MFEISEIRHAQWNDTFRLHRPDPGHRAFGYCNYIVSRIQKSSSVDNNYVKWKGTFHSDRPPEILMTGKVKFDYFQRWSQILRWDWTKTGPSYLPFLIKFPEFWAEWKVPPVDSENQRFNQEYDSSSKKLKVDPFSCHEFVSSHCRFATNHRHHHTTDP